jgi:hypothetical protein
VKRLFSPEVLIPAFFIAAGLLWLWWVQHAEPKIPWYMFLKSEMKP